MDLFGVRGKDNPYACVKQLIFVEDISRWPPIEFRVDTFFATLPSILVYTKWELMF